MKPSDNKIDIASPYRMLRVSLNPLTLVFTGAHKDLETPFHEALFSNNLDHFRRCKLYAIFFFGAFGALDAYVFPEQKLQLWFIRYGLVCPVFIAGLLFSYTAGYRRFWQITNNFYIVLTGLAYVAMVVITPAPASYYYSVGIIFCVFFGYTFIHARFINASIAGLVVLGGFQVAMFRIMDAGNVVLWIFGAHFLGLSLLGMIICYSIEIQQRKNFFLNYLLEAEKRKTNDINRDLEKRVEERTAELQGANRDLNKEVLERQQAEARLLASHEQLSSILDSIDADIHVSDMKTHVILLANRHMKHTFGSDIVGKKWHRTISNPDTHNRQGDVAQLFDEKNRSRGSRSWEAQNPINDRWYINYTRAITWEDGRVAQLNVSTDITAMKEMETRLQRAQKMEAIGTLAGGVAHDLNNILSGLVGYPELLLMDIPEDDAMRSVVETVKRSGEKAAAIVQDLLTLARRGVAVNEVVGLNRIVADYFDSPELDQLKSIHPGVTYRLKLADTLFNIFGSPVHLDKTIMNLVTNAAEAMPEGGDIFLSTENCYLDCPIHGFETVPEGEYVHLRVADGGVGIPSEDLEQIFEPFFTKKEMGRSGTGLGMAVVWGTVKDHGGFIDARSIEAQGTVFDLYFPITRQEVKGENADLPIDGYCGNGETILVVDDIEEQRDLAAFMLERLNYAVHTVAGGQEAIAYIRTHAVDILVLDMIMAPQMDGLETYRRILDISPGQKAIITSGFSESQRVKETQALGAGRYVKKPYRMEQIGMAIHEQLASRSMRENPAPLP